MRRFVWGLAVTAAVLLAACGPKPKSPVSGADLVAPVVAGGYSIVVDNVVPAGAAYDWTISAVNGSPYSWKGTLIVKLVDGQNKILESHEFPVDAMVPPSGKTSGLKFNSPHRPLEQNGDVAALKVEVNIADYKEPQ
jgi:hypothetical protein